MANKVNKQKAKEVEEDLLENGSWHKFTGYSEDNDEPILEDGELVKIVGYDEEEETYNVVSEDGKEESLFAAELEEEESPAPVKKRSKKPVVEDDDDGEGEEEDEDEAPKKGKAKAKAEETEEVDEEEEEDTPYFTGLGTIADEDENSKEGKKAIKELRKALEEAEDDENNYKTWAKAGAAMDKLAAKAAKAAAKAAKPAKVEKPEPEPLVPANFKKITGVKTAIEAAGGDALAAAHSLLERVDQTYFVLGGVLADISKNKYYEKLLGENDEQLYSGQPGFAKYCENTLGMKYRKAQYLIQLYLKFTSLGFNEKKLAGIGWSKLRALVNVVDEENVNEWVESVKDQTVAEVEAAVKMSLTDDGDGTGTGSPTGSGSGTKTAKFTFVAHADKAEVWKDALDAAAATLGIEDKPEAVRNSEALDHIISEWLTLKED